MPAESSEAQNFLPDLCGLRTLLTVLVVAQLLVFIIVLSAGADTSQLPGWDYLGLVSLFVHWVALVSIALLCVLRKLLARLTPLSAAFASYLLVLIVTFILSFIAAGLETLAFLFHSSGTATGFALRNTAIAAIVSAIALRFIFLHEQHKKIAAAETSARFQALQARIRPHFLFNSMNTIAALIRSQPKHAENAIEDLAELFRLSLADTRALVSLREEIESVDRYLRIEKLRLGSRLGVEMDLGEVPMDTLIPPLSLQPLVENAVYHGIEPLPAGGIIHITAQCIDNTVRITIVNPRVDEDPARHRGNQIALTNIRERLVFAFGPRERLVFTKEADRVVVSLSIPLGKS